MFIINYEDISNVHFELYRLYLQSKMFFLLISFYHILL